MSESAPYSTQQPKQDQETDIFFEGVVNIKKILSNIDITDTSIHHKFPYELIPINTNRVLIGTIEFNFPKKTSFTKRILSNIWNKLGFQSLYDCVGGNGCHMRPFQM
jgi:hypothetical protein